MKDDRVRRGVKRAALAVFSVSLWLSRRQSAGSSAFRYELGGACRRSGRCCEAPALRASWLVWYAPLLRWMFLRWQQHVNGFVLEERRRADRLFVFRCTHFEPATRSCDSYSSRPGMCRHYPRALIHQSAPEFFPGCGYRARSSNRRKLLEVLESQSLDAKQMHRLKKGLYLE